MACGNNHVSRDYLSSQPAPISQRVPPPGQFQAPKHPPGGRVDFFVDESGRAAAKGTVRAQQIDFDRHVHVVYNADTRKGGKPTGAVMIQVTDRSQPHSLSYLHQTLPRRREDGRVQDAPQEVTVFLRPQTPAKIEAEVRRAVDVLKSRARGSR